jgi:hypothetical protein
MTTTNSTTPMAFSDEERAELLALSQDLADDFAGDEDLNNIYQIHRLSGQDPVVVYATGEGACCTISSHGESVFLGARIDII